ncbi:response regulator transcription factor [Micromonospora sp. WMMD708]|uniref:response regulator transcription factor n=1 Tax=Micromonospora sp. WMMD708 TaxID=3403464 RepID=UPI003BF47906
MRVLVVQDDLAGRRHLVYRLEQHGYQAWGTGTGKSALQQHHRVDLVVLDMDVPDIDGLRVCAEIRRESDTPIIALTGPGTEVDRVLAFWAGCDDCLDKPFGADELLARIDAVLRRLRPAPDANTITHGPLHIDVARREARLDNRALALTRKEFDLLSLLAARPGVVFSRRELRARVWRDSTTTTGRTIDTHVNSLRAKLGDTRWIVTVRGVGFQLGRGISAAT